MALVKDPVARARKANTKLAAARLHLELESELGLNDDVPAVWETQAEEAIGILESKASEHDWGDLRDAATVNPETGAGWTPSLSRGAARGIDRPDPDPVPAAGAPANPAAGTPAAGAAHTRRRVRAHSARRRLRLAGGPLGSPPPAVASTRQLVQVGLWGVLGLSLLYLLLRDAENPGRGWPSAVQAAVASTTNALMAIVRPVDPLRPHGAAPQTPAQRKAATLANLPHLTKNPPATTALTGLPRLTPKPPTVPGPKGRLATYPH